MQNSVHDTIGFGDAMIGAVIYYLGPEKFGNAFPTLVSCEICCMTDTLGVSNPQEWAQCLGRSDHPWVPGALVSDFSYDLV